MAPRSQMITAGSSHCWAIFMNLSSRASCISSGFLALVEEILVRREIVHARLDEEGGDLRNGEHLVTAARKVLNDLHERCCLTGTGTTGEDDFLYSLFCHRVALLSFL